MKCSKCGAENQIGAKFCKECGNLLKEETSQEEVKISNENKVSFIDKIKTLPKKVIIGIIVGIVAIIAIVCVTNAAPTINFDNYLTVETSGYDGYGEAYVSIDWDSIEQKYGNKLKYSNSAKSEFGDLLGYSSAFEALKYDVNAYVENSRNLSNGDELNIIWNVNDNDITKYINCKIKYGNKTFTVSGLEEANKVDLFKGLENSLIKFEGRNGNAYLVFNGELEDGTEITRNDDFIVVLKDSYNDKNIKVIKDNQELASLYFEFDKDDKLSNGDEVNVSLSNPLALIDLGYLPERDHITFVVSDRPELIANMTKEEAGVIEEYLSEKIQAKNSENYTYSNANIHRVYFGKAKETTVTDYPYVILVDYSYSYDYSSRYYSNHQDYDNYAIFYDAYKDNGNLVFEKENTGNSYSSWGYKTIEEVMEKLQGDYDFEMIWE